MPAPLAAAATPADIAEVNESLDAVLTTLATCALLLKLRRPTIERLLDQEMARQILRGLAVDMRPLDDDEPAAIASALAPIFEAALQFLRVHESYADEVTR
ncbi:MAG: hypothetical protein ABSF67_02880 [Roseiarcus sp.]|jgi:hypothetical protein